MTNEEIQQKAYEVYPLDLDRHLIIEDEPYDNNKEKREAYIKGLTDSKPSLPSNLDEAAEKYFEQYNYMPKGFVVDAFKAGAEWMARQGQSKEGIVCDNNEFVKFHDDSYIDLRPDLNKTTFDVKDGDEVIVQIRKK